MRTKDVSFYSEGERVSGLLRLPDGGAEDPLPAIVQGPGFHGMADAGVYEEYHRRFTDAGYAVLAVDYRGYGDSEGEALIVPERQAADIRNAITYARTLEAVDGRRIGTFGTGGTGGANAAYVAGVDDRVSCVVANAAFADGADWVRSMRREYEYQALLDAIEADRERRVLEGEGDTVPARGEDGIQIPTPERESIGFKDDVDTEVPEELPLRCAEAIVEYRPVDVVDRIDGGAMFVCIEGDAVTPPEGAARLFERAEEPKKLVVQRDTTHYAAYDDYADEVIPEMVDWYDRHLRYDPLRIEESVDAS